jgi:hypothetical protein
MTDDQQTARDAFIRELERNERFNVAVTVVWITVAMLVMVLIFALVPY